MSYHKVKVRGVPKVVESIRWLKAGVESGGKYVIAHAILRSCNLAQCPLWVLTSMHPYPIGVSGLVLFDATTIENGTDVRL